MRGWAHSAFRGRRLRAGAARARPSRRARSSGCRATTSQPRRLFLLTPFMHAEEPAAHAEASGPPRTRASRDHAAVVKRFVALPAPQQGARPRLHARGGGAPRVARARELGVVSEARLLPRLARRSAAARCSLWTLFLLLRPPALREGFRSPWLALRDDHFSRGKSLASHSGAQQVPPRHEAIAIPGSHSSGALRAARDGLRTRAPRPAGRRAAP